MESVRDRKRKERQARRKAEAILREQQERARERLANVRQAQGDVDVRAHNALIMGLMPRINGAVDSWCGRNVQMKVEFPAPEFSAWTDFTRISIAIPETQVSLDFVGDLRGLAYHEAGHVRKTVPLTDVLATVLPVATEVVDDDTGEVTIVNGSKLHFGPHIDYIKNTWGLSLSQFQRAWNILEDQRMETAMVRDSKNLGAYYNVIVLTHVLNHRDLSSAWTYLVGREHVDADVRAAARQEMVAMHGDEVAEQAETLVRSYMAATDIHTLWAQVIPFALLLQALGATGGEVDGHGDPSNALGDLTDEDLDDLADRLLDSASQPSPPADDSIPVPMDDAEGDEPGDEGTPSKAKPGKGESKPDAEGGGEGDDDDDDDDDTTPEAGEGAGTGAGDVDFMKRLGDALDRAKERRNADKNLAHDVRSFNEAYRDARSGTPLRRLRGYRSDDRDRLNQAIQVNRSLRTIFESARAEMAPSWQESQPQGVLDVLRYRLREPGDHNFFVDYADGGDMHLPDLAVSLVLDGSGSMHRYDPDLGMAAFAVKSACDIFGIPCTVSVYDYSAWLLWDAEDRPLDMPCKFIPGGGTDPREALGMIDAQRMGKTNHLVIIMTDGVWGGGWMDDGNRLSHGPSLADYRLPNRDVVLLFWNTAVKRIRGMETTSHHGRIDSLMEIPAIVRRHILAAL